MASDPARRHALRNISAVLLLPAVIQTTAVAEADKEKEVEAAEDLMREHGVLRRALLVYAEAASRLASGARDLPVGALRDTATLFRTFGEDYHERALEEKHVFPVLAKSGGNHAQLANVLRQQHDRGREITAYLTAVTDGGRLGEANAAPLGRALVSFVRMYQHHAAIEDTVIFPAWKAAISGKQYEELSDQFEDLERKMFGKDGFEDAVARIGKIEEAFGLADLSRLTAPPPPKPA